MTSNHKDDDDVVEDDDDENGSDINDFYDNGRITDTVLLAAACARPSVSPNVSVSVVYPSLSLARASRHWQTLPFLLYTPPSS